MAGRLNSMAVGQRPGFPDAEIPSPERAKLRQVSPFQGLVSLPPKTQGVALGYRISPRRGFGSPRHRPIENSEEPQFPIFPAFRFKSFDWWFGKLSDP